jgi:DNA-binding IclR family transcriptional regulator
MPTAPPSRAGSVQSVETGGAALLALAQCGPAATLSRLAEQAAMPAAKLHRYLQALIASGFAIQDNAGGRYSLGPAALEVGLAALRRLDPVEAAAAPLAALRDATGLTALFAVWANHGATVVRVVEALGAVTVVTRVGSVLPLVGSATGLVFAAFLPPSDTAGLMPQAPSTRLKADATPLGALVETVRADRICLVHGMLLAGIDAAAAPVFGAGGHLVGVVTVLGPANAASIAPDSASVAALRHAATAITASLGGAPAAPPVSAPPRRRRSA